MDKGEEGEMSKIDFTQTLLNEAHQAQLLQALIRVAKAANRVSYACVGYPTEDKARAFPSAMVGLNEALHALYVLMNGDETT